VVADNELLHRMLLNLLLNALQETPSGGRIRLVAEERQDAVFFLVENTGPSISQNELVGLFKPTVSAGQDGRRLGLSIAKKIVDCHEGRIYAEPTKSGKRVVIVLPRVTKVAGPHQSSKKALYRTASKGI
jgi:signal transduction histidine kinase